MSESKVLSPEERQVLDELAVYVAKELKTGVSPVQLAARLVRDGVLDQPTAQALTREVAARQEAAAREKMIRDLATAKDHASAWEAASRAEQIKAEVISHVRETGFQLGDAGRLAMGLAVTFAATALAAIVSELGAWFAGLGAGVTTIVQHAATLCAAAAVVLIGRANGTLWWYVGCALGYATCAIWLLVT